MRRRIQPRRGISSIWVVGAMPVVLGFCSLGVDWGHVQLVKMELRTAADAAARYAVTGIATGVSTAQSMAVDAANDNNADGTAVSLDTTTDIEFGTWSSSTKTFTVLTGSARSGASAMRITARRTAATGNAVQLGFAKLIGKSTADVTAVAIATISQSNSGGGYGIVGLGWVNMSGNPLIDSYNSASGPYSSSSARNYGTVICNSWVNLNGNATIKGDVHAGQGAGINKNGHTTITGSTTNQTSNVSFAMPTTPGSYTNLGNVNLNGNNTLNLTAGNYYASNWDVSGNATVNVTGQVTLYVNGNFGISGNANINVLNNLPKNFRVRMVCSAGINLSGNSSLYADLYGPQSPVNISGNGDIYGAVISAGISQSGNAGIHYDESLGYGQSGSGSGGGGGTGQISLVK